MTTPGSSEPAPITPAPDDPAKLTEKIAQLEAKHEAILKGNTDLREMVGSLLKSVKITPPGEPAPLKPAEPAPEPKSVADLKKQLDEQRSLHQSELKQVRDTIDAKERALTEKDRIAAITAISKAPTISKIGQELLDGVLKQKVEMIDGKAVIRSSRELAPGVKHDDFIPMEAFVESFLKERPEIVLVPSDPTIIPSKGGARGSEPAIRLADLPNDYEVLKADKALLAKALKDHPQHVAKLQAAFVAKNREATRAAWNAGQPGRIQK